MEIVGCYSGNPFPVHCRWLQIRLRASYGCGFWLYQLKALGSQEWYWMRSLLCKVVIVISFRVCARVLSHVRLSATPWTIVRQGPLSMGFSRQEYCSGFPFPSQGYLPVPGIKPTTLEFLNWQADSLLLRHLGISSLPLSSCLKLPIALRNKTRTSKALFVHVVVFCV